MSEVPPTLRQSRKTVRPVLALYQLRKPAVNSCRIASLWGETRTRVSSALSCVSWRGRRMNGRATIATSARTMIPLFNMGCPLVPEDDHVLWADARVELLGARAVGEARVQLEDLERRVTADEVVLGVLAEVDRLAYPAADAVAAGAIRGDRPALGAR